MSRQDRLGEGFTIIETMLYLAISGMLLTALLFGIGGSIASQRYRDSVTSLQLALQQPYNDVINVKNFRDSTACGTDNRGQGSCFLLGRYMTIGNDGEIRANNVVGIPTATTSDDLADIPLLQSYSLTAVSENAYESSMEWGTQIAWPVSGPDARTNSANRVFSMLVLKSPSTGMVYTFTADNATTNPPSSQLKKMIIQSTSPSDPQYRGRDGRLICIQPNGWTFAARTGISLNPNAASASAVEVRTEQVGSGENQC